MNYMTRISYFTTFCRNVKKGIFGLLLLFAVSANAVPSADLSGKYFDASNSKDFSGANFSNAIFREATFEGTTFENTNLRNADFSNAELAYVQTTNTTPNLGIIFKGKVNADGANFSYADFDATMMNGCNVISRADFTDASLRGAIFSYARFYKALMTNTICDNAVLNNTTFMGAIFSNASVKNADFTDANVYEANFTKSNLTGTVFTNASMGYANFTGANLTGANFTNADFHYANLSDAIIKGANFTGANGFTASQLRNTASYKNKDLSGINLSDNNLSSWDFSSQNLSGAIFSNSVLTSSNFKNAIIKGADFTSAVKNGFKKEQLYSTTSYKNKDLSGINLSDNNLSSWDFSSQNLSGAIFSNSVLSGADFTNADLRGAKMNGESSDYIVKNTINTDGNIANISMENSDDFILVRNSANGINAKISTDESINDGMIKFSNGGILEFAAGITLLLQDNVEIVFDANGIVDGVHDLFLFGNNSTIVMSDYETDEAARAAFIGLIRDSNGNFVNWSPDSVVGLVVAVPEASTVGALFGVVALFYAIYRRKI